MIYDPTRNPRRRRAPTPHPDYVIVQHGQVSTILDARYRDLWEHDLPTHWLYQLAIYALSQPERRIATIPNPTIEGQAREARIELHDPVYGTGRVRVVLRPVNLIRMEQLITGERKMKNERERIAFARWLAFGED